jgi:hypothetical protein
VAKRNYYSLATVANKKKMSTANTDYGNISSSYSILGGMPFASHASLLRQPNVGYR